MKTRRQPSPSVDAAAYRPPEADQDALELATFGAGCFWCFDAVARRLDVVHSRPTGYAGGSGPAPRYWDLHRGWSFRGQRDTAHTTQWVEAVQVQFDPRIISFRELIDLMFKTHDPTLPNQDGANTGAEYHSTIYYHSGTQRDVALEAVQEWTNLLQKPVVTSVVPFTSFYPAEPEHQDFYDSNPGHPYCRYVIIPKLKKVLES